MLDRFFPSFADTIIDNVAVLAVGLALLIKGSQVFVKAASAIARHFGVSEFVIGLTLIAIGTSLPELVSAIIASMNGQSSFVLGNVVGANVSNITLIVGGAAALRSMPVAKEMLKRDGYMALFTAILLGLFAMNGIISWLEGSALVLLFLAYTLFLIKTSKKYQEAYHISQFARYFFKLEFITDTTSSIAKSFVDSQSEEPAEQASKPFQWRDVFFMIGSILFILIGGNSLVDQAVFFSDYFELPQTLVGVLVAIGTTAPEMSVTIVAARKGLAGMIIGNAIGSVLCNALLILGIAATVSPISVSDLALYYAIPFLFLTTVLMLVFKKTKNLISRVEGVVLLLCYIAFLIGYAYLAKSM